MTKEQTDSFSAQLAATTRRSLVLLRGTDSGALIPIIGQALIIAHSIAANDAPSNIRKALAAYSTHVTDAVRGSLPC